MTFWDASAVASLCVEDANAPAARTLASSDPDLTVWWGTRVECHSAIARVAREGVFDAAQIARIRARLRRLSVAWQEVLPSEEIRSEAERLLAVHPLRAADAFHLASAIVVCGRRTSGVGFAAFDRRLREAAAREGFTVRPSATPPAAPGS